MTSSTPARTPQVVIFGNSAGGQFVNRYAAVGRGPGALAARGIQTRFIVANPSTYLYFGDDRPHAAPGRRPLINGGTDLTAPTRNLVFG